MATYRLAVRQAVLADLDWLKPLADRHRAALGFVRRASLIAGIGGGEVLVSGDGVNRRAFCRFHRRRDGWGVVYELVSECRGAGRALLEAVARPRRLKCPVDLPANEFYRHCGGLLAAVEPGKRRPLNVWLWP